MASLKDSKEGGDVLSQLGVRPEDTGSSQAQIVRLTERINRLGQDHFKIHPKDKHSLRGLHKMVNTRRKLLDYLKRKHADHYQKLLQLLGLRR